MASPEASAVVRANNRKLRGDLQKSRSMFSKTFRGISGGIRRSLSGALSPLGVGAGLFGIAAAGSQVLEFEKTLTDIKIQADLTGEETDKLRSSILALSQANAQGRNSLAQASKALVDLQGAIGATPEKLEVLSTAALATGAPVEELAGLIFSLENSFKTASPEQLREALDAIITAGKRGAIPLNEMNAVIQDVGVTFAKFSEQSEVGASRLAVSLQFLRRGFGSASQAGTGLEQLLSNLVSRELELKKAGIRVKDSAGQFRPLLDIVEDFDKSRLLDDPEKFNKAFGKRIEGRKALELLIKYRKELIAETRAVQGSDSANTDAAKRRQEESFKIEQAFNRAKEKILSAFTPGRIEKFTEALEKGVDALEFVVDHAREFAIIIGGIKLASLGVNLASMATTMAKIAESGESFASTSGRFGKFAGAALALPAAAAIGWGIGRAIDDALGLSNKFSDFAIDEDKQKAAENSAFLRDLSRRANLPGRRGELARKTLVTEGIRKGIISPSGRLNESRARQVGGSVTGKTQLDTAGFVGENAQRAVEAEQLVRAMRRALKENPIVVQVAPDAQLRAVAEQAAGARRSPQE